MNFALSKGADLLHVRCYEVIPIAEHKHIKNNNFVLNCVVLKIFLLIVILTKSYIKQFFKGQCFNNVLTKSLGFFYLLSVYIFDKLQSSATFTSFVCIHIIHVLHQCLNKMTIYSLKNNHISRGNKSSYLLTIHLINWYFFFILKQWKQVL